MELVEAGMVARRIGAFEAFENIATIGRGAETGIARLDRKARIDAIVYADSDACQAADSLSGTPATRGSAALIADFLVAKKNLSKLPLSATHCQARTNA